MKMVVYIKCQEKQTPLVKIFLSPAPYIKPTEVICEGAQREVFDLIQEITFLDNTLILKGISKENNDDRSDSHDGAVDCGGYGAGHRDASCQQ